VNASQALPMLAGAFGLRYREYGRAE